MEHVRMFSRVGCVENGAKRKFKVAQYNTEVHVRWCKLQLSFCIIFQFIFTIALGNMGVSVEYSLTENNRYTLKK